MFDVKPTDSAGNVDNNRVKSLERTVKLERRKTAVELALLRGVLRLQKKEVVRRMPRNQEVGIKSNKLGMGKESIRSYAVASRKEKQNIEDKNKPSMANQAMEPEKGTPDPKLLNSSFLIPTSTPKGLEGHNFLPSREELLRELEIIEKRDRKLQMLAHLTKELERESPYTVSPVHVPKKIKRLTQSLPVRRRDAVGGWVEPRRILEKLPQKLHYATPSTQPPTKYSPWLNADSGKSIPHNKQRISATQALISKFILPKIHFPNIRLQKISLPPFSMQKFSPAWARAGIGVIIIGLLIGGGWYGKKEVARKTALMRAEGILAYNRMQDGLQAALDRNFSKAEEYFADAHSRLRNLGGRARMAGRGLALIADVFSLSTPTVSDVHVLEAAEKFAKAGEELSRYAALFSKNGIGTLTPKEFIIGYLSSVDLQEAKRLLSSALTSLGEAQENLSKADVEVLPLQFQESITELQKKIPPALAMAKQFASFQDALFDIFGYLGPRKYLVIFQNSAELRPTGGFIGSYALLDILDGKITRFFIDDIFNIDGQLVDKVVPPEPIQKISTAWSLHDANWFFDYPASAKKIAWFYEKTGGASVDGVIAITPEVLESFFTLSGNITLPGYNLEFTKENFRDELSWLIEEGTPKKEGESPKVVLRDLGTLLIDAVSAKMLHGGFSDVLEILTENLERHSLLLWVRNPAIEEFLVKQQWGGSLRVSDGDYLAVVHTNINGYKTDRVIREEVAHRASIADDGSIVDTITITRTHYGSPLDRYDALYQKVNADYLRVYVPQGSHLIEASGYTEENVTPSVDYAAANFSVDPEIGEIASSARLHYPSGTHITEESGKTVFGNWVYVSPGEGVVVHYTYKLPWRVKVDGTGSYTMLVQKQPGVERAIFNGTIVMAKEGVALEGAPTKVPFDRDIEYSIAIK